MFEGNRSVTVGKIVTALIILTIGYWLCLYLAAQIGRRLDDASLLLSELVTNAILHGGTGDGGSPVLVELGLSWDEIGALKDRGAIL